jgi:small-conductance mechanosensitive channel
MKKLITISLLILFTQLIFSQEDTAKILIDTLKTNEVDATFLLLRKADSIRLADSISKEVLRKQIDELRTYETSKRKKLEAELNSLVRNDSVRKTVLKREIDSLRSYAQGYAIIPHKDTIYEVYTKIGTLTAKERSEIIQERLRELYQSYLPRKDSLTILDQGQSADIFFRDNLIISITEADALWYNITKMEIATKILNKITNDILIYKDDRNLFSILKKAGLVLLILIIQIAIIYLINLLFRSKINTFLWSKRGTWFKGIKIKDYEILNESRQTGVFLFLSKILRYLIIIIQLYITIPLIFSLFPLTKRFAEVMFGYILTPLKSFGVSFIDYIPKLFTIIVIVVITKYILKFLRFLAFEIESEKLRIPGFFPDWGIPSFNILKILIYAFMFIVIFPYLPGSDSQVFKGVSVFLGIVFTLGSSSIIGNMVAGLVLTYMRPFKIGDRIKIGDVVGNVVQKTPFVTRIRTPKKEFVTVPNSNILSSNVINYSNSQQQGGLIVHTSVTIGYDVPWRQVHQLLTGAAKKTSYLNLEIAPFVLQTSLDDFYVSYELNAHTNEPDKLPAIYSELHQNIQDQFNDNGIEILSPHYRAARDGNHIVIPPDYVPKDYKSPGFKVEKDNV